MSASSKKKLRKEQSAAQLTEKQLQQAKEAKKNKTYTAIFCTVVALVLVVGLVILVSGWINTSGIVQRMTTALTVGEHDISGAELNYFYIDVINYNYNSWYESYGDYLSLYTSMMGLDMSTPLDEQTYDAESGQTWADYFADLAIDEAVSAYALYDLAKEAGYEMTETEKASITSTMQTMQTYADSNGVSLKEYMKSTYGNGSTPESFQAYLEVVTLSSSYAQHVYDSLTYTQEEIDAHSEANYIDYTAFSYASFQVNPNEFIQQFCSAEEDDTEHVHTDEENDAALAAAAEAANALADGDAASLEALNDAISAIEVYAESEEAVADESHSMLYTNIANEDIKAWVADSARQPGDKTVIANTTSSTADDGTVTTTPYAYTVVLFLERNDNTDKMVDVRHILKSFSDDTSATEFTDEQKATAKEFIENLMESWENSGATEENFEKLAISNSTDSGSASNGGLYTNVFRGQMVTNFDAWCFDESRQPGDYGIVESDFGYHLIYYVRQCEQTYRDYLIESDLRNTDYDTWYQGVLDESAYTVHSTSPLSLDLIIYRSSY